MKIYETNWQLLIAKFTSMFSPTFKNITLLFFDKELLQNHRFWRCSFYNFKLVNHRKSWSLFILLRNEEVVASCQQDPISNLKVVYFCSFVKHDLYPLLMGFWFSYHLFPDLLQLHQIHHPPHHIIWFIFFFLKEFCHWQNEPNGKNGLSTIN